MRMNQKKCININFSNGPGIFNKHFWYPEIDNPEIYSGLIGTCSANFFLLERKELIFDTDNCPYLHIDYTEPTFKED